MILNDVINDCPYNELTIQRKVFNTRGEEETYAYVYAEKISEDGWMIRDAENISFRTEITGFRYKPNDTLFVGIKHTDVVLEIYTPITWTLYDGVKSKSYTIRNEYDARNIKIGK